MHSFAWQDSASLPQHDGHAWALHWGRVRVRADTADDLRATLTKWSPVSTALVGRPGDTHFRPAVEQPEFAEWLNGKYRSGQLLMAAIWAMFMSLAVLAFLLRPKAPLLGYALCGAVVTAMCLLEAHWAAARPGHSASRTLFFYWLRNSTRVRRVLCVWLAVAAACGLTQLLLMINLGGLEPLVTRLGAYYPAIQQDEYWRLLSGPFFHSGIAHFVANSLMLLLVGTVCMSTLGRLAFFAFLLGSIAGSSAAAFHALSAGPAYPFDSFAGYSGGIYSLLALLIVAAWRIKGLLPSGISVQLLCLLVLGMVSSSMITFQVSSASHLAGLSVGVLLAVVPSRAKQYLAVSPVQGG